MLILKMGCLCSKETTLPNNRVVKKSTVGSTKATLLYECITKCNYNDILDTLDSKGLNLKYFKVPIIHWIIFQSLKLKHDEFKKLVDTVYPYLNSVDNKIQNLGFYTRVDVYNNKSQIFINDLNEKSLVMNKYVYIPPSTPVDLCAVLSNNFATKKTTPYITYIGITTNDRVKYRDNVKNNIDYFKQSFIIRASAVAVPIVDDSYPNQSYVPAYSSQHNTAPYPSQHNTAPYPSQHNTAPYPSQHNTAPYPSQHNTTVYPSQHNTTTSQHNTAPYPSQHNTTVYPSQHNTTTSQHNTTAYSPQPSAPSYP
jgi:hypothetical protein